MLLPDKSRHHRIHGQGMAVPRSIAVRLRRQCMDRHSIRILYEASPDTLEKLAGRLACIGTVVQLQDADGSMYLELTLDGDMFESCTGCKKEASDGARPGNV